MKTTLTGLGVVALLALAALVALAPSAAATTFVCPADVGVGDPQIADPWLLTNDAERYPAIRDADTNGDGYACIRDPFLITLTTVLRDDTASPPPDQDFQLFSLDRVRELDNPRLLDEATRADRNGNGFVLIKFVEGGAYMPVTVIDNLIGDPGI